MLGGYQRILMPQPIFFSKLTDFDDYAINDFIFQKIDDLWGPHTVNRFACSYNAK